MSSYFQLLYSEFIWTAVRMAITDQIHREKGGFAPLPEPLVFAITWQTCRKEPNPSWHYKDTRMSSGGTQTPVVLVKIPVWLPNQRLPLQEQRPVGSMAEVFISLVNSCNMENTDFVQWLELLSL